MIRLDAVNGTVEVLVDAAEFDARPAATADLSAMNTAWAASSSRPSGAMVGAADQGASVVFN